MTQSNAPTEVVSINPTVPFTVQDRVMLTEMHEAITTISKMLQEVLPNLGKSPIGRMLGL